MGQGWGQIEALVQRCKIILASRMCAERHSALLEIATVALISRKI